MKLFRPKGSALVTVIILTAIMALMTGYLLTYSFSERRMNERQRLVLRSRNMSENVVLYASEQITNKLYKLRSPSKMAFLGANAISLPPDNVLITEFSTKNDVEVRAGLLDPGDLTYIDPADPDNATNPNAGLQVSNSLVPIIGKSTMSHSAVGEVTTYAEQTLEVAMMPLFQFAIFYNMDLEFGPGPDMTISGPVHTNGDFIARIQTGHSNTIRLTDRVTAAKGFYANTAHRGPTYMGTGSVDDGPGGDGPLYFRKPTEAVTGGTNIKASNGIWRDHKWASSNPGSVQETATSLGNFRNFATSTYAGNLRTSVHGVTPLVLPAIGDYDESTEAGRKNGRQIIEPPLDTDAGGLLGTKFGRNAGLYIAVNPTAQIRTGRRPTGATVTLLPHSYRAWLNTVNNDGTHTLEEVVLPGQPSYGYNNNGTPADNTDDYMYVNDLPNAYRVDTAVGHNQVLRIPQAKAVELAGTGYAWDGAAPEFDSNPNVSEVLVQDAYFWDMRRAFNNTGYPYTRSSSNRFRPRPIAKIDFDMTRFKLAVERSILDSTSATIYNPGTPSNYNWSANVLNSGASPASFNLGIASGTNTSFDEFPSANPVAVIQTTYGAAFYPASLTITASQQTGTGTPDIYTGRIFIETTTATAANMPSSNGASAYSGWSGTFPTTDASSATFTPTAGITAVRISLYTAGTTEHDNSRLLSQRTIPVVSATSAGVVTPALSADRIVIPANSNTSGFRYHSAAAEMRIYIDGIDDTENWTFSAARLSASGSVSGSLDSSPFGHRYEVSGVSTSPSVNSGIVRITASKRDYPDDFSRDLIIVKQKSIIGAPTTNQTGVWSTATQPVAVDPFRIYYAPDNPGDTPVGVPTSGFVNSGSSPWYDGITVYIHSVDAEDLAVTGSGNSATRNRVDSGVRLWNGRGPAASLPGSTYPGRTGFSFVTNDAVYIMGHFNADGDINSTLGSTGTGGYSGRYPESTSEMLTSVMGDAINIFSQPEFSRAGSSPNYRYYQNSGWSDSLSAHRSNTGANYSSTWFSSNPSNSNTQDGLNVNHRPALMPNLTVSSTYTGPGPKPLDGATLPSSVSGKFSPSETEVSACLLTGIVPTTKSSSSAPKQTSGGVHNFPRLSENWAGSVALYIRGSLVAMFESQVATEPWGIRWYQGAIRNWGLHESLRNANHDVPLEPIVLNARRMSYRELSADEYDELKDEIEDLPH